MRKIYLLLFTALALFIAVNADAQTKPTNKKITGSVDSSLLKTKNILSIIDPGGDGGSGGTGGTGGTTAASTTTAVANANTTFGSTAVNLIATVTANPDGGTVTFLLKDYPSVGTNTSIGTATKGPDTRYTLVYNPSALPANTYTVMANFGGTTAFASSTSDISPNSANGTLTVSQCSVFDRAFSQDAFICGGGGTQFVYLGTAGPGAVIRWYSDAQGTNLIGEGTTLGVSAPANYPGTIDRYDTYVPNGTITYYARYEDPAPCLNATLQAVSVTVVYPSFATGARAMNDQLCSGNSTQLILEGLGAQSSVIKWYTDAGGTNLVGEGNGMYVSPTQTTTYYGRYEDSRPCIHYTPMRSVTVYVYTSSVATGATASNSSICSGGITQLILQGTAGSGAVVQWFSDAGGTNLIGEGNNFSVSPTVATTYFGRFDDHSICQTQTPLLPVTINIITDNQYPTLSATPMVTGNADAGVCTKMLNLTAPTASDNCGIAAAGVTASGIPPANNYPVGTTTVTWSVTDVNGNTTTQTQSVVITDNQYPTLSATPMVTGNADAGVCTKMMNLTAPTASDNCGIAAAGVTASGIPPANNYPVGTTTVTWSVTDVNGNTTTQTQSVVITDNQYPTLSATPMVTGNADAGVCTKMLNLTAPTASDNCGIAAAGVTASGIPPANNYPVGTTTVTWSVTDVNGNTTTQTQSVVITDNQYPTLSATPMVTGNADAGVCTKMMNLTAPTASDNCGIAAAGVTASGIPPANNYPVGTTTVTWSVTDVNGNTTTQTQSVVITDTQYPTLSATPMVTGNADAGVCTKMMNLTAPTASDNCGIAAAGVTASGIPPANNYPVGTTTVTWSVTDVNGNTTTQTQSVVITDNQYPTLSATPMVTGNADAGVCTKMMNLTAPTASDNCGIAAAGVTASGIPPANNYPVGTTTVTWSVTDVNGNTTTQTQSVVITDNQYPTLSATPMVTGNADAGVCTKMLNLTAPTASDNCGIAAAGVTASGIPPANNYPVGTTTVTWSVTDVNGNTTTQTQSVVITDREPPVITSVSTNPSSLWPPNHKMKAVPVIINSTDNCPGAGATCKVISITSNEPISNLGNGDTEIDYEILGDQLVNLRAERSASGEGRVYTITVQCDDGHGNIATKSTIVRVAHNIKAPAAGSSVKIGTTINMTGTFWDITGNKHTAKWLVDGASIKGTLTEPAGTKNGTVSGSYKLATTGVYRLQMNVTDQKGVTSYATTNGYDEAIVVAYDPNGGYTYGGKKYISPKGALPSNPNVAGEMTYGFETNYYKGAVNPKGETWFALNNGEFEFNALNFDYLVVSGAKAQFKGLGKMVLNGIEQSGIAFILTVIDGQLNGGGGIDKIRMKIYNKNSGEVYYDNQPGASDADAPVTVVENNIAGDGIVVVNTSISSSAITQALKVEIENAADVPASFGAMAYPNPSPKHFTIQIKTDNKKDVIRMIVYDWSGRTIERNSNVPIGQLIRLGSSYTPGVYIVEIIQGNNRVQLKLIKQPD